MNESRDQSRHVSLEMLDEIEGLARAASPGPWWEDRGTHPSGIYSADHNGKGVGSYCGVAMVFTTELSERSGGGVVETSRGDAKYIARMDPPTALALTARVRELEELVDTLRLTEYGPEEEIQ